MFKRDNIIQIVWGIALTLMGIMVIYKIPEKFQGMGEMSTNNPFAKLCFYLIGIMLILGGLKKLYDQYTKKDE
ncbi:hypothetical protein GMMP15_850030 [Candidatus Magnetomoraceae bacterium gMMP-15]